ncbi:integrase catalytic domain-containing protein [Trichonephila clavipes]|nr:integrase catalytic domain-containing protein [Trichonephila clavipes]
MSREIVEFIQTCKGCQLRKPEKIGDRAPITPIVRPELPFEIELKIKMEKSASLTASQKQKAYGDYFNKRFSVKNFSIGEQVVLLIPDSTNKIYERWTRPGDNSTPSTPFI